MTSFMLKLIAIFTMFIDHTGAIIYPYNMNLRIIGRLAFPIFAFLIAEGYSHTRSFGKYIFRMFIFAMISQIPFYIALVAPDSTFNISDMLVYFRGDFNVMFTFVLALFAIWCYEFADKSFSNSEYKNMGKLLSIFAVFSLCLLAASLNTDYAYYGVLLVFVFYFFKTKLQKILGFLIVQFIYIIQAYHIILFTNGFPKYNPSAFGRKDVNLLMIAPLVSAIFIYFYNGQLGTKKLKWVFYVFYPAHILILYLINLYFFS